MLVTQSGSPLLIGSQKIITPGRFVDNFQRGATFNSSPVGMGWTDMGILQPANFDKSHIYDGRVGSADPYWREKHGTTMAPDDQWEHYANYPGLACGGFGAMIRNVGNGIYNYDVTTRVTGVLSGGTHLGPESEGTPLVGVNVDSDGLGYGAWFVNLRINNNDTFLFLIGTMGNPGETFFVTHTSGPLAHTQGQARDITLKYRGTTFTVWLDGVQVTNIVNHPSGSAHGAAPIPVTAPYQNKSWAGFEYDQHITPPTLTTTTPSIISYSHQAIT